MNARGPAVCRDRKRIGLLNQKSSGKIFFGGSWLPSDMEKRFSLFWFPRLFPEPARICQLSRRRLNCPATCCWRAPVILQTDWKNVQMRHLTDDFQLRVLTRGAICPSLPPKPEKIFFFGYRTLIYSLGWWWRGVGVLWIDSWGEVIMSFLLGFFIFSHLSVPLKKPLHVKTSTPSARHSVCTPFSANQA